MKMNKMRMRHWSTEEIEEMTTEEVIKKLRSFHIYFDKDEFLKYTNNYLSSQELTDEHYNNHSAVGFDEDFIWMAIMVLWKRLRPDKINVEMISDEMQKGYDLLEESETKKAIDVWLKTWSDINILLPNKIKSVREADNLCTMTQSIFNWSQDLLFELYNYSIDNDTYIEKGIMYCDEFCGRFIDDYSQMQFATKKAVFLYGLGKGKEAIRIFEELLEKYSNEPNVYYGYANTVEDETERVYKLAIERGVKDKGIVENLILYYEEKGDFVKVEDYKRLLRKFRK